MKHLRDFPLLAESQTQPLMGFVLHDGQALWYGAAPTFWEFAREYWDKRAGSDWDSEPVHIYDLGNLDSLGTDELSDAHEDGIFDLSGFWWGLQPRSSQPFLESHGSVNPFVICRILEEKFTNAKEIMTSRRGTAKKWRSEDPGYLVKSLENDPSALSWFSDYNSQSDRDHSLEEVLTLVNPKVLDDYFSDHPAELDLLDELPDLKASILRRTGLPDVSRAAGFLRKGLF